VNFDEHARRESQSLIDALTGQLTKAAGAQFDALRAEIETRAAALKDALSTADHSARLAKLLEELSVVAREEAETLAARARLEAEKSGERKLTAARTDAAVQLDAARTEAATLLSAVRTETAAQLDAARADAAAQSDAARTEAAAQLNAVRAEAAAQLDAERADALVQSDAVRAEAAQRMTAVQRDMAALRAECDQQRESLTRVHGHVKALESERAQLVLAQDESRKQLKAEMQVRSDLASTLEAARLEASLAKIDLAEQRENLELAAERVRTLEMRLAHVEADANAQRERRTEEDQNARLLLLDTVQAAMQAIQRATMPNDILEILLESVGRHFDETAVFLVGSGFRGWRARRLGAVTDLSGGIPEAVVPLLTRIAASREPLAVAATDNEPLMGLAGKPIASAVALPLCVDGTVHAVVYAEDASSNREGTGLIGLKVAEILVDQATRRLTKRSAATDREGQRQKLGPRPIDQPKAHPPPYSSPRQARRVKMQASVDITLDGSASFLIDLSSLGAQVLSPLALRPNRLVEMELVGGEKVIHCRGCVVWALFEHPSGTTAALYRAGIRFTEVDLPAVDSFLAVRGVPQEAAQDAMNMFGVPDSGALDSHRGAKKSTAS
jgi:colicin import membrane protein